MEKDKFFTNEQGNGIPHSWTSIFGMEMQMQMEANELNSSAQLQPNCFLNPNWNNPMDQGDPFESALSSIVSSPVNSNSGIPIPGNESVVLRELIGRLGSICNSGEVSNGNNSANTSCYNTPLSSPPKLNLSIMDPHGNLPIPPRNHQFQPQFSTDPGFVERAARFSCFGGKSFGGKESELKIGRSKVMGIQEKAGIELPIPSIEKKVNRLSMCLTQELENSMEESSVSEGIKGQNVNSNGRKRKAIPKGKGKETPTSSTLKDDKVVAEAEKEESDAKRSKSSEDGIANSKELGEGNGNQKQTKENAKAVEPPKDYIHVRARRGQATDSHSLAERVRREKISERMKFLQDLVPGCNKVTGKAVMLDEIINYVQSLQRQVEFLSMKLATVNPRMDVGMESLLSKDMFQPSSLDALTHSFPYGFQSSQHNGMIPNAMENPSSMNNLLTFMHHNSNMKPSHVDGFGEASAFWENDLQSVVQMGLNQNQPQTIQGTMGTSQMKVEL